jgi:hypothetical protein
LTPRDRVFLVLLGQSDPNGCIDSFEKSEALDYARLSASEFERELDALIAQGRVFDLPRAGQRARRFQIMDLARRREATDFIESRRDWVLMLAARRALLEPQRAPDDLDEIIPRVVRVELIDGPGRPKYGVTAQVGGLGTIRGWYYYPPAGEKAAFIAPPARKVGDDWIDFIDPVRAFREALMRGVVEFLRDSETRSTGSTA